MGTEEEKSECCPFCNQCVDDGPCDHLLAAFADGKFLAGAVEELWEYYVGHRDEEDEVGGGDSSVQLFQEACESAADRGRRRRYENAPTSSLGDLNWARDCEAAVAKVAKALRIFEA